MCAALSPWIKEVAMGEATMYEQKDHLAILTLNRPEAMNAMNAAMRREMGHALVDFRDDVDAWVLIITGAGDRAFCAGMDLREMASNLARGAGGPARGPDAPRIEEPVPSLMAGHIEIWKPIIAAINGVAVGGGLETVSPATSVSLPTARGWASPNQSAASFPVAWAGRLPRLIPLGAAMEILLTGDLITAQEAYRIGLVNQVAPAADLMPAAKRMAERLMESAPLALRAIKETVMKTRHMSLEEALPARFGPT